MSKKPHLLAGLVAAAVVLSTLAHSAQAQGPDRVPRFMMIYHSEVPLDWDADGSVAMVVMPQFVADPGTQTFATTSSEVPPSDPAYADTIYSAIVNTLERNLAERISAGEITEAEIGLIADLLFDALDGRTWYRWQEVTHVAKGGAERLGNVYFDSGAPQGAMAQAGPDGDVLVLGEFWLRRLMEYESVCNPAGVLVVTDNETAVQVFAQLAIGWFTK